MVEREGAREGEIGLTDCAEADVVASIGEGGRDTFANYMTQIIFWRERGRTQIIFGREEIMLLSCPD